MLWAMLALAQEVSEEVVVWAQSYARFDDKRWLVRSEIITPSVIQLGTETHRIRVNAWQIEAVIHCKLDGTKKRLREAHCAIEDLALRAHLRNSKKRDTAAVQAMVAAMKGQRIQLQVNQKGRVPSLDLDGLDEGSYEERQLSGGARTLMKGLAAAFHMEIPKESPRGASWVSAKDPLLVMAAPIDGLSSSEVSHRIDVLDGHYVQQTLGRASSTTAARNMSAGIPCFRNDQNPRCPKNRTGEPLWREEPDFLDLEITYKTELNAVSVLDLDRGYPTERMWSVTGKPSGASTGTDYWAAGNLRELGKTEAAAVGASGMVNAPRGKPVAGLPPWVSVAQ